MTIKQALLTANNDMNNVTTPGFYHADNANNPANAPEDANNAAILVLNGRTEVDIAQWWLSVNAGSLYFRRRAGGLWTSWVRWH